MSISPTSGTITIGSSATTTITTNGDGLLSCSSSTANAECSITGSTLTINAISAGSATITVSQGEGTTHIAATPVTYTATIEPAVPTMAEMCPGCEFMYPTNLSTRYYYSASNRNSQPLSTRATFAGNNDTLVSDYTTLNKNYFLGFKFDGSGNVTNAYACGINANNNNIAFCIEGITDGSKFSSNVGILNTAYPGCNADASGSYAGCNDSVDGSASSYGYVDVYDDGGGCYVDYTGSATCY